MPKITIFPPSKSLEPLKIVFCLPGREFSGDFLEAWSELMMSCQSNGILPRLVRAYDPIVYFVRNKLLGGNVLSGRHQKPFQGQVDYDYLMWIDSDVLCNIKQVLQLVKRDQPIVSGLYMMADGVNFATVKDWDTEYFGKNGSFKFLTEEDTKGVTDLMEVAYTGFGFMLIKRGVFESLEYPWFRPVMHNLSAGNADVVDFSSEDSSVCWMLREKGYKIFVDPTVRVGHEKRKIF